MSGTRVLCASFDRREGWGEGGGGRIQRALSVFADTPRTPCAEGRTILSLEVRCFAVNVKGGRGVGCRLAGGLPMTPSRLWHVELSVLFLCGHDWGFHGQRFYCFLYNCATCVVDGAGRKRKERPLCSAVFRATVAKNGTHTHRVGVKRVCFFFLESGFVCRGYGAVFFLFPFGGHVSITHHMSWYMNEAHETAVAGR